MACSASVSALPPRIWLCESDGLVFLKTEIKLRHVELLRRGSVRVDLHPIAFAYGPIEKSYLSEIHSPARVRSGQRHEGLFDRRHEDVTTTGTSASSEQTFRHFIGQEIYERPKGVSEFLNRVVEAA
jgi:hypothetical protein